MAPRLQLLSRASSIAHQWSYQPLAPFLYPFLAQHRNASILSSLSDNPSAYSKRIRRGRGPSSGKGKTSGRGHKGQGQHGKVPAGFNGGQTPDWVVHGKRGYTNRFAINMSPVNLNRIQYWINKGRLDPTQPITINELVSSDCIHGVKDGVKLLAAGKDELTTPINIVVSQASAEAINAVEKIGGTVVTRYYTKFAIEKMREGEMDPIHSLQSRITMAPGDAAGAEEVAEAISDEKLRFKYRLPDPTSRKALEYYRDSAHRGYLSHTVQEGHGPSLFFKPPGAFQRKTIVKKNRQSNSVESRMW